MASEMASMPWRLGACGLALALVLWLVPAVAAEPAYPELTGRVVDDAQLLGPDVEEELTAELKALEDKSSDQLAKGVEKQDDNGDQHCGNGNDHDFRPGNDDRQTNNGRDVEFPRDYRPSNPNWRDRLNEGNGDNDRSGLFPGGAGAGGGGAWLGSMLSLRKWRWIAGRVGGRWRRASRLRIWW